MPTCPVFTRAKIKSRLGILVQFAVTVETKPESNSRKLRKVISPPQKPVYTHVEYIQFGYVCFYGISTIVGNLIPNPPYTFILNIYDL